MIEELGRKIVELKKEFVRGYDGQSQIQEIIPKSFPIPEYHLEQLHEFAAKNPIYYNSFEKKIRDTDCVIYEGDINRYWLNSIEHDSSKAPFSPTWIMSGYIAALFARELGYFQVIDIGSGDGRIAFCAKLLEMKSYSIEIDCTLVELQKSLTHTLDFEPYCADAMTFDYSSLNLTRPIFFIGGLAQMGGATLASGVINAVSNPDAGWVFPGTLSKKYALDPKGGAGWGTLIEDNHLNKVQSISLPTAWTLHETDETLYVFAESQISNPN